MRVHQQAPARKSAREEAQETAVAPAGKTGPSRSARRKQKQRARRREEKQKQQHKPAVRPVQEDTQANKAKIPPPPPKHVEEPERNTTTAGKGCEEDGIASTANIDVLDLPVLTQKCSRDFSKGDIIAYKIMELQAFQPVVSESRFGKVRERFVGFGGHLMVI